MGLRVRAKFSECLCRRVRRKYWIHLVRCCASDFRENFLKGSRTGILVSGQELEALVAKWIRGVHYCELGWPVPENCIISVQFVEDDVAARAFGEILQYAQRVEKGPGVQVLIWHVKEGEEFMTQFAFQIWQKFRVYGAVETPEAAAQVKRAKEVFSDE